MNENSSKYICAVLSDGRTLIFQSVLEKSQAPTGEETERIQWMHPLIVRIVFDNNGNPNVRFDHLAMFSKSEKISPIDERHILCKYEPEEDLKKVYQKYLDNLNSKMNMSVN